MFANNSMRRRAKTTKLLSFLPVVLGILVYMERVSIVSRHTICDMCASVGVCSSRRYAHTNSVGVYLLVLHPISFHVSLHFPWFRPYYYQNRLESKCCFIHWGYANHVGQMRPDVSQGRRKWKKKKNEIGIFFICRRSLNWLTRKKKMKWISASHSTHPSEKVRKMYLIRCNQCCVRLLLWVCRFSPNIKRRIE